MSSQLVQMTQCEGRVDRVPRGQVPVIELHLEPGQYVANVELTEVAPFSRLDRKTVDWRWTAYVVNPLGGPDAGS